MISGLSDTLTHYPAERKLADVLERYLVSLEANTPLDVEQLAAENPGLADDIRTFAESVDLLHHTARGFDPCRKSKHVASPPSDAKRLGDFEIGAEIGRGGMGVVYEARQISLGRKVALKVLPFAAMWDRKQIARFQMEAQAAAQLHHPHIVPVFAVGQERGVHFYAMQLIQGRSLEQILSELRQSSEAENTSESTYAAVSTIVAQTTERVGAVVTELSSQHRWDRGRYCREIARLGTQAAAALHYAHECGVVHRDVKPSNLLLDENHDLWITDFGLARVQDHPGVTITGDVVGTLRYMSPEQASGRHALIDPRADVYSLGASLYELLTLKPVFPGEDRQAVLRDIAEREPTPPRQLNPSIPVDLETIVLQALAKSCDDRYASAGELAEDLNRFLDGIPTRARRPTFLDRAAKWVRRHRTVTCLAAVSLLALTTISTFSAILISREQQRTEAALAVAEENLQQARQVVDRFGTDFSQRLARLPGSEPLQQAVLLDTLDYYRNFIDRAAGDPSLQHQLAETHFQAGSIAARLGEQDSAIKCFQTAAKLFIEQADDAVDPTELQQKCATSLNNLALLYADQGKLAEASAQYDRAIDLIVEVVRSQANAARIDSARLWAELLTNRGMLERQRTNLTAARVLLSQAIDLLTALTERAPQDATVLQDLALAYNNRSFVEQQTDWLAARDSCVAALGIFRRLVEMPCAEASLSASRRSDLALCENNLAAILGHLDEDSQAISHYRRAVEIQSRLARLSPSVVQYRSDLAVTWNNLGQTYARLGNALESDRAYGQAQQLFVELLSDYPDDVRYCSALAGVLNNRALAAEQQGNLESAAARISSAIDYQRQACENAPEVVQYREFLSKHLFNYGRVMRSAGRVQEAVDTALQRRKLWPNNSAHLYQVALELAASAESLSSQPQEQKQVLGEVRTTLDEVVAAGGNMVELTKYQPLPASLGIFGLEDRFADQEGRR